MIYNVTLYNFELSIKECKSCMLYIILLVMTEILIIMAVSGTYPFFTVT